MTAPAETRFAIGDRVWLTDNRGCRRARVGDTGTVTHIDSDMPAVLASDAARAALVFVRRDEDGAELSSFVGNWKALSDGEKPIEW